MRSKNPPFDIKVFESDIGLKNCDLLKIISFYQRNFVNLYSML